MTVRVVFEFTCLLCKAIALVPVPSGRNDYSGALPPIGWAETGSYKELPGCTTLMGYDRHVCASCMDHLNARRRTNIARFPLPPLTKEEANDDPC